jgi:hypothetical protein
MARLRIETAPEITVYDEAFVIKAAANATAPLIQFQNSSGSNVGNVSASGVLTVNSVIASSAGTTPTDLATRGYVDSIAAGTSWHQAVSLATNAALPACTYNNGTSGVGATLTADAFGLLTIDGENPFLGDSVLVKNQANAAHNGIYTVTDIGDVSVAFILTRRTDADNSPAGEMKPGDTVYVIDGTVSVGNSYVITSAGTGAGGQISIGVDNIVYSVFSGTAATQPGAGLTRDGNTINVISANSGRIQVNADSIDLATINVASTAGSNTTTFVDTVYTDSYGRVTEVRSSSVSFAGYAATASPGLTGTPTAPTANAGTNSTQIATTEFVQARALVAEGNAANSAANIFVQKASFDSKGDILVGTADNTLTTLAVGTNGYVLKANSAAASGIEWAALAAVNSLDDIVDVTITTATSGQFLKWNGSAWINESIPALNSIDDITGVTLTDLASGNFLKYNGSAWVNDSIDLGTDTTGNYVSNVTSGTGITVTHTEGEGSSASVAITNTAVTAGAYTYASVTVNAQGQLTAASSGTAPVTSITEGTGVTISGTTTPTISIGQSVATNASVTFANITATGTVTLAADPSSALQAVTKQYVDNISSGVHFHESVVAATTGNLAGTYNNGTAGVGATLTKATNGSIGTIDGASVVVGNRILVKSQTDSKENGIYTITAVGSVSAPWVVTRATDADNNPSGELAPGDFCFIMGGNTNAGYGYVNNSATNPIVIGTDNITYAPFNAAQTITNGSGINLVSNVLSVDTTTIQARVTDVSDTEIGYLNGVTSAIQTQLNDKAPLASPTFTGTVTLPAGTISNADVSSTAAIEQNKIADTTINAQAASYTLVLADKNKLVEVGNASANTLTVPPNSSVAFPVGSTLTILQTGAGQCTITAGAGVTINGTPGLKLRTTWSSATLIKRATDTWVALGDLVA